MVNYIIGAILIILVGCAVLYIIREKKKGRKCIGCPNSGSCNSNCNCNTKK